MPITKEKAKSKYFEKGKCIICRKEFWKRKKPRSGRGVSRIRGPNVKTCSHRCSKKLHSQRNASKFQNGKK